MTNLYPDFIVYVSFYMLTAIKSKQNQKKWATQLGLAVNCERFVFLAENAFTIMFINDQPNFSVTTTTTAVWQLNMNTVINDIVHMVLF